MRRETRLIPQLPSRSPTGWPDWLRKESPAAHRRGRKKDGDPRFQGNEKGPPAEADGPFCGKPQLWGMSQILPVSATAAMAAAATEAAVGATTTSAARVPTAAISMSRAA